MMVGCVAILLSGVVFPTWVTADTIAWKKYDEGLSLAKKKEKKVFLHFYASWCYYCKKMAEDTFGNAQIVAYINKHFVPVRVDIDRERKAASAFNVRSVPATWFFTETGKGIDQVQGYYPPEHFLPVLKKVSSQQEKNR